MIDPELNSLDRDSYMLFMLDKSATPRDAIKVVKECKGEELGEVDINRFSGIIPAIGLGGMNGSGLVDPVLPDNVVSIFSKRNQQ